MINPEDFYSGTEYPGSSGKKRMWNNINRSLPKAHSAPFFNVDLRSFAFGFGMAFTVIFVCVGIFTVFSKYMAGDEPAYIKINNAYSKAIEEVEKSLPQIKEAGLRKEGTDDYSARMNKLSVIDAGINEIKSDTKPGDFSPVKQTRLRELYKMKLEILSRLIDAEESSL